MILFSKIISVGLLTNFLLLPELYPGFSELPFQLGLNVGCKDLNKH